MAKDDRLRAFVGEALAAGRSRDEIAAALARAGWSGAEAAKALSAWDETPFAPPIPRPTAQLDPRDATVNGIIFLAMILAAVHLVLVGHALVDLWVADPVERWPGAAWRVRWSSAMLIVSVPVALLLDRRERRRLAGPEARPSTIRDWIAHLTAFVAGAALLINAVALVHGFLGGDLTLRFALKVLVVAAVAGLFLLRQRPGMRAAADILLVAAAVAAIAAGLVQVGGPRQAREMREDGARLAALRMVAGNLACGEAVAPPPDLAPEALAGFCGGRVLAAEDLRDPVSGAPLRYEVRGPRDFAVCADFHDAARATRADYAGPMADFDPATGCLTGRTGF